MFENDICRFTRPIKLKYISDLIVISKWEYRHLCGRNRMVVGFTATYAISAYHHWYCQYESLSGQGVLDSALCDKVCQWLASRLWFSRSPPVSFTCKTDLHYITEVLLKVVLNTMNPNQTRIGINHTCIKNMVFTYHWTVAYLWKFDFNESELTWQNFNLFYIRETNTCENLTLTDTNQVNLINCEY